MWTQNILMFLYCQGVQLARTSIKLMFQRPKCVKTTIWVIKQAKQIIKELGSPKIKIWLTHQSINCHGTQRSSAAKELTSYACQLSKQQIWHDRNSVHPTLKHAASMHNMQFQRNIPQCEHKRQEPIHLTISMANSSHPHQSHSLSLACFYTYI